MKNIKTVEIVKELLRRAERVDAILELIESGVAKEEPKAIVAPRYLRQFKRRERMGKSRFLEFVQNAGGPRSAPQLAKLTGCSTGSTTGHLQRLCSEGKIRRIPGTSPFLYESTGAK